MSTDDKNWFPADPGSGTEFPELDTLTVARAVAPPSAAAVAGAQAALRAAVEREEQAAAAPAVTRRVSRVVRPRRWIATGVAVAAAATGAAVLPVVDFGGKAAANASAATFLNETAKHAASAGRQHGKYWKVSSTRKLPGKAERRENSFLNRDMVRLNYQVDGKWIAVRGAYNGQWRWGAGPTMVTWDQLNHLPTGTAALRARLTGTGGPHQTFDAVGGLLGSSPASPELRAALYRVLASTPGIHLDGTAKDSRGRTGTSVSITYKVSGTAHRQKSTLLIDPRTTDLLQTTGGKVQGSYSTYLFSGWVNKIS